MQFHIFDVGHGFCASLVADNGNVMLFDCGHDNGFGFRPSRALPASGYRSIQSFIVSNYDEDHISDLPNLRRALPLETLYRNQSITTENLRRLKLQTGPLGSGMQALLDMINTYTSNVSSPPDFAGANLFTFCNFYPIFTDTNNLSLVSFIEYQDLSIVVTGDLEKAGWKALLARSEFLSHLARVRVFIASHHGRESGYLKEVFDVCSPDIIIISDEAMQYETQETNYAIHSSGVPWSTGIMRYVLTTRRDGHISISSNLGGGYQIMTSR